MVRTSCAVSLTRVSGLSSGIPFHWPMMVWLEEPIPDEELAANKIHNAKEVQRGIDLANEFADIVVAVNVGNEALVEWNDHMVPLEQVIAYVRQVKEAIDQPVTVAENYVWWINEGAALARAIALDPSIEGGTLGLLTFIVFLLGLLILIHELGHAVAARSTGAEAEISLDFLAGYTSFRPSKPLTRTQRAGISIAGPFTQIAISVAICISVVSRRRPGAIFGTFL